MAKFNHFMLTLAREARGLTQAELADGLKAAQGTLSKYETGLNVPPSEFVEHLGAFLGFPADFFYQQDRPYGFPPFHFRKRKKLSAKALGRIVAEMNIRRMHVGKMMLSFGLLGNRFIPEINMDEYRGKSRGRPSIEDVARLVRESWMLPSGPIPNLVEVIEENGGIVIPCDFQSDLLDAMSQRIDGMPVLFFINANSPADRIRYTLAHELGHMVLHTTDLKSDDEMEDEADEFAGAFMLPADEFRPHLRQFDLRHIANMKGYWKVSMAAIAVRAHRLNLITPYQSKTFWMEMSRLGYRRREPNEPSRETPKLLRQMVEFHRKKLGYSGTDMAQFLCANPRDMEAMYSQSFLDPDPARPYLRVVK